MGEYQLDSVPGGSNGHGPEPGVPPDRIPYARPSISLNNGPPLSPSRVQIFVTIPPFLYQDLPHVIALRRADTHAKERRCQGIEVPRAKLGQRGRVTARTTSGEVELGGVE